MKTSIFFVLAGLLLFSCEQPITNCIDLGLYGKCGETSYAIASELDKERRNISGLSYCLDVDDCLYVSGTVSCGNIFRGCPFAIAKSKETAWRDALDRVSSKYCGCVSESSCKIVSMCDAGSLVCNSQQNMCY